MSPTAEEMRELRALPSFTPAQVRSIVGVGDERKVLVFRVLPAGHWEPCEEDQPINLRPGDDLELICEARSYIDK